MRGKLLTLVAAAAMLVGGLAWTDTAEAQRRWRGGYGGYYGGYYGAPVVRSYRPYYANPYSYGYYGAYPGYSYYRPYGAYRYSYGYPGYSGGYYGSYPGYYYSSPGVYLGGRNAGVYFRF